MYLSYKVIPKSRTEKNRITSILLKKGYSQTSCMQSCNHFEKSTDKGNRQIQLVKNELKKPF